MDEKKLAKASLYVDTTNSPYVDYSVEPARRLPVKDVGLIGPWNVVTNNDALKYREDINQCRFFYRYDPIASTVINRMGDMAITNIRIRKNKCSDEEYLVYSSILRRITPLFDAIASDYLITGMAVPDYVIGREMGTRLDPRLKRTRYEIPTSFWVRDPSNILLKRRPTSLDRSAFIEISDEEAYFINNEGRYKDGTTDFETYRNFVREFPAYVQLIKDGVRKIPLPNTKPILRKVQSDSDYPTPFLVSALSSLQHKLRIKQMDYSIATRAIEAVLHIKMGSDEFPVENGDTDIEDMEKKFKARNIVSEPLFRLITNHVVEMGWVMPDVDALLSDQKYIEPNSDILMAMGFPRKLLVGEALRSNAGQDTQSTLGPLSTLNEMRRKIIEWVQFMLLDVAEKNSFKNIPIVSFAPITVSDMSSLASIAVNAVTEKAISRDTLAGMFGSSYEEEREQIALEEREVAALNEELYPTPPPDPTGAAGATTTTGTKPKAAAKTTAPAKK